MIERLGKIAQSVRVLRLEMEERRRLTARIEARKHAIKVALAELGHKGAMPWTPVRGKVIELTVVQDSVADNNS